MSVFSLALIALLIVSVWYRISAAKDIGDYARVCAMFQYLGTMFLLIGAGYFVLEIVGPSLDLAVYSFLVILLALASVFLPAYEFRFLALGGSLIILIDENNRFAIDVVLMIGFIISASLGAILGSRVFLSVFRNRIGSVAADKIARRSWW